MRGQAVIREIKLRESIIWRPDDKQQRIHRGVILALGEPCFLDWTSSGVTVPWDCAVGDIVLFTWSHNEAEWTKPWTDGEKACWIPQWNVHAVVGSAPDVVVPGVVEPAA